MSKDAMCDNCVFKRHKDANISLCILSTSNGILGWDAELVYDRLFQEFDDMVDKFYNEED